MPYQNFLSTGNNPQSTDDFMVGAVTYQRRVITVPNVAGTVTQSFIVTPSVTAQEITTYRLLEKTTGQMLEVVSDASPTATEVVTLLKDAWTKNAVLNGIAESSGTTTFIVKNRSAGISGIQLDLIDGGSTPTNTLSVAKTAGKLAENVGFGLAMTKNAQGIYTLPTAALSASNLFGGVTTFNLAEQESDPNFAGNSPGYYMANAAIGLLKQGQIPVLVSTAVETTSKVFISFDTANATNGQFRGTAAANYSEVIPGTNCFGTVSWEKATPAGSIALLNIDLA